MVESGPGLRSGLTADIRARLKMHLIIKGRGKRPKQTKSKAKEMSAKWLAPERHKKQRTENVQIPEAAGFRGHRSHCMHSSRLESFPIFADIFYRTS